MMALLLNANDSVSRSYSITKPSPLHPIYPSGAGEKTSNWFDKSATYTTGAYTNLYTISGLDISKQYTCSTSLARVAGATAASIYLSQTTSASAATNGVWAGEEKTFTPNENGELYVLVRNTAAGGAPAVSDDVIAGSITIMLNEGSVARPFEPFGYKIPVNVKSANLWNEVFPEPSENMNKYIPIYVGDGDFTFSTNGGLFNSQYALYMFMAGRVSSGGSSANNGVSAGHPRTVTAIDGYVTIVYHGYSGDYYPENFWGMLNAGTIPLPHQPYSSTTTNIYLGSATSTRKIKKLVLTGEETDWTLYQSSSIGQYGVYQFYINKNIISGVINSSCRCNITPYGITAQNRGNYLYGAYPVNSGRSIALQMKGSEADFPTVDSFKTFLQQQYANGTPVTVWYILSTEETGIVNEPLMKIGDYADEISVTGLPTLNGVTVYDCDLEVKPSKMYVKYRKHGT